MSGVLVELEKLYMWYRVCVSVSVSVEKRVKNKNWRQCVYDLFIRPLFSGLFVVWACMRLCVCEWEREGEGERERHSHFLVPFPSDLGISTTSSCRRQSKLFDDEEQQDDGTSQTFHSWQVAFSSEQDARLGTPHTETEWLWPWLITLKSKVTVDHLGAVSLTNSKTQS